MKWKMLCLNMFNAPPPLFWRGGWEVRPGGEVKTANIIIFANL